MKTVNAFRFTAEVATGTQQIHVAGEFSAPDRLHETVVVGSGTLELVKVGTRTYRRDKPTAPWQAVPATNTNATTDPRVAFDSLAAINTVQLDGSTYRFTLSSPAAAKLVAGSKSVTGAAVLDAGRITDLRYQSSSPSVTIHLTYSAFNSIPAVTPPIAG
jgi:hypothetical protein